MDVSEHFTLRRWHYIISPIEPHTLLHVCEQELHWLDMSINVKKSACMRVGPRFNAKCHNIITAEGHELTWVDDIRYLGVYVTAARTFNCSIHNAKRFFTAHLMLYLVKLVEWRRKMYLWICWKPNVYLFYTIVSKPVHLINPRYIPSSSLLIAALEKYSTLVHTMLLLNVWQCLTAYQLKTRCWKENVNSCQSLAAVRICLYLLLLTMLQENSLCFRDDDDCNGLYSLLTLFALVKNF